MASWSSRLRLPSRDARSVDFLVLLHLSTGSAKQTEEQDGCFSRSAVPLPSNANLVVNVRPLDRLVSLLHREIDVRLAACVEINRRYRFAGQADCS